MIRILLPLLVPTTLLIAAAVLHPELAKPALANSYITPFLPLLIGLPALMLCLRFNRSRYFFSLLSILIAYSLIYWVFPKINTGLSQISYQYLSLLLPFNLLFFSVIRERGMLTLSGSSRFIILIAQGVIVFSLHHFYPSLLTTGITFNIFNIEVHRWTAIPQLALLSGLLVALILNGRLFAAPSTPNAVSFAALICSLVMLQFYLDQSLVISFATAASLMFTIAIIQESHRMAYIDQLTLLPGRRALNEQMLKLGKQYTIAMVDIDKFKKFNDKYGHDIGDQVLRMVAAKLAQTGASGKAFRYGGEEFCILFSGKDIKTVTPSLEALREAVATSRFDLRKQNRRQTDSKRKTKAKNTVQVTISIGVAQRNEKLNTTQSVLKAADKALYRAKQKGRNRISK